MDRKSIKKIVKLYEAYITAELTLQEANANYDITKVDRAAASKAMWEAHTNWRDAQRAAEHLIHESATEARGRRVNAKKEVDSYLF